MTFPIFIGFDRRDALAYFVLEHSLRRHTSLPLDIRPLILPHLVALGAIARPHDPLASTEFTYTRFLVPHLCGYEGWALYMDGDMLARVDVTTLLRPAYNADEIACEVVKHEHSPSADTKADGRRQTRYRRKNWSSLIRWNCGHPANRALTPAMVSRETGAFLHQLQWLDDHLIGSLDPRWNWLAGYSREPDPLLVHYTDGVPYVHEGFASAPYADEYLAEMRLMMSGPR